METNDQTPPADGQPPLAETPESTPVDTGNVDEIKAELERVRKALKDANKEAADRRKKLEAFEAAEKEKADKELTESQRLQKELEAARAEKAEMENRLKTTTIKNAVLAKAGELNFDHPADALALIDLSSVEISEDGKVIGFEKALEDLAKSGRLKMKGNGSPGIGTPRGGKTNNQQGQPQQPQRPIVRF